MPELNKSLWKALMPGIFRWVQKSGCEFIYDWDFKVGLGPNWRVMPECKYGDKTVQIDMGKVEKMFNDVQTESWTQDVSDYIQGLTSQLKTATRLN